MLMKEIQSIKSTPKELREFGFVVGGALIVFSGLAAWRHGLEAVHWGWPAAGVLLALTGVVRPSVLRPFQRVWMALALVMGWVMSRVILTLLFCLIVTPIALILRVQGKQFLGPGIDPKARSYWNLRTPDAADPKRCERQY